MAAATVLSQQPSLWSKVVIDYPDQEWSGSESFRYLNHRRSNFKFIFFSGVFKFKFWRFGKWQQVLVDDFIPVKDGSPLFTFSKDKMEWWPALLEKAYAK